MWFGVLGPLSVHGRDGEVTIRRDGHRRLLCRLLLDPGRPVATDRLVEDLWGQDQPRTARKSVQVYVSELRRLLAEDRDVLRSDGAGYALDVDPGRTDAGRFEAALADGTRVMANGEAPRSAQILRNALGLWRGEAFADVAERPWAAAEVSRLHELRQTTAERLMDAELAVGRHEQVLPELADLVAHDPLREDLRALLMVALFRSGRQAEALELYRDTVVLFADELGIDPSPRLGDVHGRILRQDVGLFRPRDDRRRGRGRHEDADIHQTTEVRWIVAAAVRAEDALGSDDIAAATSVVDGLGGLVLRGEGPELLAVFGAPVAHEDDAVRALAMVRQLQTTWGRDVVGAAVHSGEALTGVTGPVGDRRYSVEGDCLATTAELAADAPPGVVLVTDEVRGGLRDGHRTVQHPPVRGRQVWAVGTPGPQPVGMSRPFVGRETERQLMSALWAVVVGQATPHLITVLGDPGVGKTRMVAEWVASTDALVLRGESRAWGDPPFGPVIGVLRQLLDLPDGTGPGTLRERIAGWLAAHQVPETAATTDRLMVLLGAEAGDGPDLLDQRELFAAVRAVLRAQAAERPTVVVLEDLQWAGRSVVDLLAWLLATTTSVPLAIVATARPELPERHGDWARIVGASTTIVLEELSLREARALAQAHVGTRPILRPAGNAEHPVEAASRLQAAARGNPLYLEQLVAWATESGQPTLPGSVRALIAARLDLLDRQEREVVQAAAVVGPSGSVDLIDVLLSPGAAAPHLPGLTRRHVLAHTEAPGRYAFQHDLVAEVALRSIPEGRRRVLHRTLALHLESSEEGVGRPSLIAHHWLGAADADRCMPWLVAAADEAAREWAHHDAVGLLDQAITLLETDDEVDEALLRSLYLRRGTAVVRWMHRVIDWYMFEEQPAGGPV